MRAFEFIEGVLQICVVLGFFYVLWTYAVLIDIAEKNYLR